MASEFVDNFNRFSQPGKILYKQKLPIANGANQIFLSYFFLKINTTHNPLSS